MKKNNWLWPLPGVGKDVPLYPHPGSFAAIRKHDIHTGIDLYCYDGSLVVACEDGEVVSIIDFTGPNASPASPWWNDTKAILINGKSGTIVYGEVNPDSRIRVGCQVKRGDVLGVVKQVLIHDKGLPQSMLHVELYAGLVDDTCVWPLTEEGNPPLGLENPEEYLLSSKQSYLHKRNE